MLFHGLGWHVASPGSSRHEQMVCQGSLPMFPFPLFVLHTENLSVQSLMSELLSLRQSKCLEGCWLQLVCYTLPKHLCP